MLKWEDLTPFGQGVVAGMVLGILALVAFGHDVVAGIVLAVLALVALG